MKKIIFFFVFFFVVFSIFSQNIKDSIRFELSSVNISAGKSYLSGGYCLSVGFKGLNSNTSVTLLKDKMFVNHVYPIAKIKTAIGPSLGYFQNVPLAGAIASFSPYKFLSTTHWAGYSFGDPGAKMDINPSFLFLLNKVTLKIKDFKPYYVCIKFMEFKLKHVVGLSYQYQMIENIHVYSDAGYDFTNEEQLLKIGVIWRN